MGCVAFGLIILAVIVRMLVVAGRVLRDTSDRDTVGDDECWHNEGLQ